MAPLGFGQTLYSSLTTALGQPFPVTLRNQRSQRHGHRLVMQPDVWTPLRSSRSKRAVSSSGTRTVVVDAGSPIAYRMVTLDEQASVGDFVEVPRRGAGCGCRRDPEIPVLRPQVPRLYAAPVTAHDPVRTCQRAIALSGRSKAASDDLIGDGVQDVYDVNLVHNVAT
jgi:hypothetical protein